MSSNYSLGVVENDYSHLASFVTSVGSVKTLVGTIKKDILLDFLCYIKSGYDPQQAQVPKLSKIELCE